MLEKLHSTRNVGRAAASYTSRVFTLIELRLPKTAGVSFYAEFEAVKIIWCIIQIIKKAHFNHLPFLPFQVVLSFTNTHTHTKSSIFVVASRFSFLPVAFLSNGSFVLKRKGRNNSRLRFAHKLIFIEHTSEVESCHQHATFEFLDTELLQKVSVQLPSQRSSCLRVRSTLIDFC